MHARARTQAHIHTHAHKHIGVCACACTRTHTNVLEHAAHKRTFMCDHILTLGLLTYNAYASACVAAHALLDLRMHFGISAPQDCCLGHFSPNAGYKCEMHHVRLYGWGYACPQERFPSCSQCACNIGKFASRTRVSLPADCPGTSSQTAGKSAACAGCPNQAACATAPKGPDPGVQLRCRQCVK